MFLRCWAIASADSILRLLQALTLCWRTRQLMHSYEVKGMARLLSALSKVLGGVRLAMALQLTGSAHWHLLKATLCQPQRTASTPRDHAMVLLCQVQPASACVCTSTHLQMQPADSTCLTVSVAPSGCLGWHPNMDCVKSFSMQTIGMSCRQ